MAATVDLGQQLQFENVKHLPPRPPSANGRLCSGGFQNRGRLFSTVRQQCVSENSSTPEHSSSECYAPSPSTPRQMSPGLSSSRHRRVQSAKARLEMTESESHHSNKKNTVATQGNDLAVFDVNMNLMIGRKSARGSSRSFAKDSHEHIYQNFSFDKFASRPSSAKNSVGVSAPVSPAVKTEEKEEEIAEDLKPSVYGYKLKRQVYGSNPDIFTANLKELQPATMFRLDETQKTVIDKGRGDGDLCLANCSSIPSHMEPLRPWLTQTVPQEVIGADPSTCLVFLPLNQTYDDLPVVPLS